MNYEELEQYLMGEIDNIMRKNELLQTTYMQLITKEHELLDEKQKLEEKEAKTLADLQKSNSILIGLYSVFYQFTHAADNEINVTETFNKLLNLIALNMAIK
ncbi:MAG: hypothetical protein QXS81_04295 [Candidatus Micrarchaeaceae archaeon]